MMHEEFEDFWEDVMAFANEIDTDLRYVEEEFLIDGELVKVYPNPSRKHKPQSNDGDKSFRFEPRPGPM